MRILLVLGVAALILWIVAALWLSGRRMRRLRRTAARATQTIDRLEAELEVQWAGDYPDLPALRTIVAEHRDATTPEGTRS